MAALELELNLTQLESKVFPSVKMWHDTGLSVLSIIRLSILYYTG